MKKKIIPKYTTIGLEQNEYLVLKFSNPNIVESYYEGYKGSKRFHKIDGYYLDSKLIVK